METLVKKTPNVARRAVPILNLQQIRERVIDTMIEHGLLKDMSDSEFALLDRTEKEWKGDDLWVSVYHHYWPADIYGRPSMKEYHAKFETPTHRCQTGWIYPRQQTGWIFTSSHSVTYRGYVVQMCGPLGKYAKSPMRICQSGYVFRHPNASPVKKCEVCEKDHDDRYKYTCYMCADTQEAERIKKLRGW